MKPLKDKITITSGYGERIHPVTKKKAFHYGVDAVSSSSKDILATADGQVVKVVNTGSKGGTMCLVRIQHKDYQSAYYHIKSGSSKVKKGEWVKKGQKIATMGNTGQVTGTHLHFQIDKGTNATAINPTEYLKGNKELVGKEPIIPIKYELLYAKWLRKQPKVAVNKIIKLSKGTVLSSKDNKIYTDDKKNKWIYTTIGEKTGYVCIEDSTGKQAKEL